MNPLLLIAAGGTGLYFLLRKKVTPAAQGTELSNLFTNDFNKPVAPKPAPAPTKPLFAPAPAETTPFPTPPEFTQNERSQGDILEEQFFPQQNNSNSTPFVPQQQAPEKEGFGLNSFNPFADGGAFDPDQVVSSTSQVADAVASSSFNPFAKGGAFNPFGIFSSDDDDE